MGLRLQFFDLFERGSLEEKMTFDQLMALSDPKRIARSNTVRVPPLKFDSFKDSLSYYFNVKSSPSTTELRHKGYIRCFKPKNPNTPLEKCECEVDCDCQDFRYMYAWAVKQRGSSKVGAGSLNRALNRAPKIKNPSNRPGLCKHLIRLREWVYGKYHAFDSDREMDTTSKLDKMVTAAGKRHANEPAEIQKAKAKAQDLKASWDRIKAKKALENPVPVPLPPNKKSGVIQQEPAPQAAPAPAAGKRGPRAPLGAQPDVVQNSPSAAPTGRKKRVKEESVVSSVNLEEEIKRMIAESEDPELGTSEDTEMLRDVLAIVRHLAGDDLPPDLQADDGADQVPSAQDEEPGIPQDAVQSSEQN